MNNIEHYKENQVIDNSALSKESNLPFYFVLIYLFLEFGRPQNLLPGLSVLHLPAITAIIFMTGKQSYS